MCLRVWSQAFAEDKHCGCLSRASIEWYSHGLNFNTVIGARCYLFSDQNGRYSFCVWSRHACFLVLATTRDGS